jgi:hypothetical protein
LEKASPEFRQSLQDELSRALVEVPNPLDQARVRAISQLESVRGAAISKTLAAGAVCSLVAPEATLRGTDVFVETLGDQLNIGCWTSKNDLVQWKIHLTAAGGFSVECEYSCAPGNGGDFICAIGEHVLRAKIASTGSWGEFRTMELGHIQLAAGEHPVIARCGGEFNNALMNLRQIKLLPSS